MKLALLTCAIYPTRQEAEEKLWIFLKSARRAGFSDDDIHLYGIGRDFHRTDWMTKKLIYQLDYLKTMSTDYTHILYSDGGDALLIGDKLEITIKYATMGMPDMVASAYHTIPNWRQHWYEEGMYDGCFDESAVYRYPHVGGYMAERTYVMEAFEKMLTLPRQTTDDCWSWMDAWKEGWFRPRLDSTCQIFQVAPEDARILDHRLYNSQTQSFPSIVHLSGGYADHVSWKDYKLEPLAKEVGIL